MIRAALSTLQSYKAKWRPATVRFWINTLNLDKDFDVKETSQLGCLYFNGKLRFLSITYQKNRMMDHVLMPREVC